MYADGIIKHTGVLAVGGDHVSNDLAYGLKVPLGRAEQLKIEHGAALVDEAVKGQTVTICQRIGPAAQDHQPRTFAPHHVVAAGGNFSADRAGPRAGRACWIICGPGVFICGGGARIPANRKLAEKVFQLPVSLGKTNSISGLKSALDQPEFATAIGLVKFGSFQQRKRAVRAFDQGEHQTNARSNLQTRMNNDDPSGMTMAAPQKAFDQRFSAWARGRSVIEQMIRRGLPAADFVAIRADPQAPSLCFGGGDGSIGSRPGSKAWAPAAIPTAAGPPPRSIWRNSSRSVQGVHVVFIVAGLGGGAGTGISPVLARAAAESGALVLAFVTMPFECEGSRRQAPGATWPGRTQGRRRRRHLPAEPESFQAHRRKHQRARDLSRSPMVCWPKACAASGACCAHTGLIEIHFADFYALLHGRHGESSFAVAESAGPARSREVMDKLLAHPMFEGGQMLGESEAVLVSLLGGPDLTMAEVNRVMEQINRQCEHAQVVMGAAIDESFRDRLAITLIAARKNQEPAEPEQRLTGNGEELDTQLLTCTATSRPGSRFVPPAPDLPPGKMEQLLAQQNHRQNRGNARARKTVSNKLRQTQLPLEIVSKGRFDKSEPTIHRGEDLDVPTYIRRGVALN